MKKLNYGLIVQVPTKAVREGEYAIRKYYNPVTLDELGASISEMGTIYPIVVKDHKGGKYELIIGSRRLRAAQKLRLEKIPALVTSDVDGRQMLELALSENLHREDLTPFEEAWAIMKLINDFGMSLQRVAKSIGRSEGFVRQRIQLLSMPKDVQALVSKGQLSMGHVDVLVGLPSATEQQEFATTAVKDGLSYSDLATLVQKELQARKAVVRGRRPRRRGPQELTGRKVSLRIIRFTGWLKTVMPEVLRMRGGALEEVQRELKVLFKEASKASKAIDDAY